ncbi:hypothetical protein D3C72_2361390 [compost metagenome]
MHCGNHAGANVQCLGGQVHFGATARHHAEGQGRPCEVRYGADNPREQERAGDHAERKNHHFEEIGRSVLEEFPIDEAAERAADHQLREMTHFRG